MRARGFGGASERLAGVDARASALIAQGRERGLTTALGFFDAWLRYRSYEGCALRGREVQLEFEEDSDRLSRLGILILSDSCS